MPERQRLADPWGSLAGLTSDLHTYLHTLAYRGTLYEHTVGAISKGPQGLADPEALVGAEVSIGNLGRSPYLGQQATV